MHQYASVESLTSCMHYMEEYKVKPSLQGCMSIYKQQNISVEL